MIYNSYLTYCSVIFFLLIAATFFRQNKVNDLRNSLYKNIIFITGLFILSEILTVVVTQKSSSILLQRICWQSHWVFCVIIALFIYYYNHDIVKNMKYKTIKEMLKDSKFATGLTIYTLIGLLIYVFVLPYEVFDLNDVNYVPTNLFILVVGCLTCVIVLCFMCELFKNFNSVGKLEKNGIVFSIIIFFILSVVQAIFTFISFIPMGFVMVSLCLFFNSENPSLRQNETIKLKINTQNSYLDEQNKNLSITLASIEESIKNINELCNNIDIDKIKDIKSISSKINYNIDNLSQLQKLNIDVTNSFKEYDIKDLINECIDDISSELNDKKLKLELKINDNVCKKYFGNYTNLVKIIQKILKLSVYNTNVGKIIIDIMQEEDDLLFTISDSGDGIKEEDKKYVFTNSGKYQMEYYKNLIENDGGKIWFDSYYMSGTTFYIKIPQKIVDYSPAEKVFEDNTEINFENKKVLLVIKELNFKNILCEYLEKFKLDIDIVSSGKDSINMIKKDKKYDLIIIDDLINDIDSKDYIDILKKLKSHYQIPPVILLTIISNKDINDNFINLGYSDYLIRPLNDIKLDKIIKKYLK